MCHIFFQPYFCGQDPRCTDPNSVWAFEQAQKNILEYYKLVGTLERLDSTIMLMEKVFPNLMSGLFNVYLQMEGKVCVSKESELEKQVSLGGCNEMVSC